MMSGMDIDDLADRLFGAIEAGDVDAVRELYAPDARVWHNTDGVEQTVDENLATLRWCADNLGAMRYTEVRRRVDDDGFVQQHVLVTGVGVDVPACIVATVRDGRISRIDEYLDSAQVARLVRR
jgi:uncharacterized protein